LQCSYKGVLEVLSSSEAEEAEGDVDLEGLAQALSSFNETASALASMYAGELPVSEDLPFMEFEATQKLLFSSVKILYSLLLGN